MLFHLFPLTWSYDRSGPDTDAVTVLLLMYPVKIRSEETVTLAKYRGPFVVTSQNSLGWEKHIDISVKANRVLSFLRKCPKFVAIKIKKLSQGNDPSNH